MLMLCLINICEHIVIGKFAIAAISVGTNVQPLHRGVMLALKDYIAVFLHKTLIVMKSVQDRVIANEQSGLSWPVDLVVAVSNNTPAVTCALALQLLGILGEGLTL